MSPKGGFRPGAGRPPGAERKLRVIVRLPRKVADALRAAVPDKHRSVWIEELIADGLRKRKRQAQGST